MFESHKVKSYVENFWDKHILPTLSDYIRIPCVSPMFDSKWREHGYLEQAMKLLTDWSERNRLSQMQLRLHELPGRTPCLIIEVSGDIEKTILLYGHMDKQPEMTGWHPDMGPWQPVIKDDRLYGRGGADDGYALFASLAAIKTLQENNIPHARCVILIEATEESGSIDLPFHVAALKKQIDQPDLIICLDSGCGNYDQLWCTTSLRGNMVANLTVNILTEGVHSGAASGIVPSSFRILRQLLSRIEDEKTGNILLDALQVEIPAERLTEAKTVAQILGNSIWQEFPWVKGAQPVSNDLVELLLNRCWRPTLSITGMEGLPSLENAGNVLRSKTAVKLSLRIPPTCNPELAAKALQNTLLQNPPYHADVEFNVQSASPGWNAPKMQSWLQKSVDEASQMFFGKNAAYWGEGGTIPFMGMLGIQFPEAQFVITGVLGPHSNAHGPNEFLHIPTAKKVTAAIAKIIADYCKVD